VLLEQIQSEITFSLFFDQNVRVPEEVPGRNRTNPLSHTFSIVSWMNRCTTLFGLDPLHLHPVFMKPVNPAPVETGFLPGDPGYWSGTPPGCVPSGVIRDHFLALKNRVFNRKIPIRCVPKKSSGKSAISGTKFPRTPEGKP